MEYFLGHPALDETERLGSWIGACASSLSLPREHTAIEPAALDRALTGLAPDGPQLGRPLFQIAYPTPRVGWELVFAPHKSVSLAALQTKVPDLARKTRQAFHEAVLETFTRVVEPLARARTSIVANAKSASLLAAVFVHHHSRRHDPHLHAHVLAFNTTRAPSGAWHRLEPRSIYAQIRHITGEFHVRLTKALQRAKVKVELRPTGKLEAAVVPSLLPYCEPVSRGRNSLLEIAAATPMPERAVLGRWMNRLNDRSRPEKTPRPQTVLPRESQQDEEDVAGAEGFGSWTAAPTIEAIGEVPLAAWADSVRPGKGRSAGTGPSQKQ